MTVVKIGYNPATNMLPMFHGLDTDGTEFEMIKGYPALHNRLLAAGELHMAPISAFAYGVGWEKYTVLPNLSVSAFGVVGSISFFSKVPLEELTGKLIALTNHSATSVNLLKILLWHFYRVEPRFIVMDPEYKEMLAKADAALLIGDEAIIAGQEIKYLHYYDLGQLWFEQTKLPMTFALWAVDRTFADRHPELLAAVYARLQRAKAFNLQHLDQIVAYAQKTLGYPLEFWNWYFNNLNYDLTPQHLQGLQLYFQLAHSLELIATVPEIVVHNVV